ncbi:MAG: cupin domain-containing protein [Syntrophobacterales bacterium]|nr:cupin domain-containing protein [Syntrophobacterales bacterium]
MIKVINLFDEIPSERTKEAFQDILRAENLRIERIISHGEASPEGFWYNQQENEWVLLLAGTAELSFADGQKIALAPGDCLLIPGHVRHRVERTDPGQDTIWLAIHFGGEQAGLSLFEGGQFKTGK